MIAGVRSTESTKVARPTRLSRLFFVLVLELVVGVILYLPIDRWIVDGRGIAYAEMMAQMIKAFLLIVLFVMVPAFLLPRGPGRSGRGEPDGGRRWRGPPL